MKLHKTTFLPNRLLFLQSAPQPNQTPEHQEKNAEKPINEQVNENLTKANKLIEQYQNSEDPKAKELAQKIRQAGSKLRATINNKTGDYLGQMENIRFDLQNLQATIRNLGTYQKHEQKRALGQQEKAESAESAAKAAQLLANLENIPTDPFQNPDQQPKPNQADKKTGP